MITITAFDNPHQADMAKLFFESEGIEVYLNNRLLVETDWLLSNAIGDIQLQVAEKDFVKAQALFAQYAEWAATRSAEISDESTLTCLACGVAMPEHDETCNACGWTYTANESEMPER